MSELRPIRSDLEELMQHLGVTGPAGRLVTEWDRVVGEPWADKAEPVGLRDGNLVVEVADGATASLLRYRVGELLERLDAAYGPDLVQSVRLRVKRT